MMDENSIRQYEEFERTLDASLKDIIDSQRIEDKSQKKVIDDSGETVDQLNKIFLKLKIKAHYGDTVVAIRDGLKNKCRDAVGGSDDLDERLKDKLNYRQSLNNRLTGLRKTINELIEDNKRLEQELSEPCEPLILKLMHSMS